MTSALQGLTVQYEDSHFLLFYYNVKQFYTYNLKIFLKLLPITNTNTDRFSVANRPNNNASGLEASIWCSGSFLGPVAGINQLKDAHIKTNYTARFTRYALDQHFGIYA